MKKKLLITLGTIAAAGCLFAVGCLGGILWAGSNKSTEEVNSVAVATEAPTEAPTAEPTKAPAVVYEEPEEEPTPKPTEAPIQSGVSDEVLNTLKQYSFFDGATDEQIQKFLADEYIDGLIKIGGTEQIPDILEIYGENGRTIWDYIGTPPTVGTDEAPQQTQAPQETETPAQPEKPVEQQPQSTLKPVQQPIQQPQEVPGTNNVEAFQDKLKDWNSGDTGGTLYVDPNFTIQ